MLPQPKKSGGFPVKWYFPDDQLWVVTILGARCRWREGIHDIAAAVQETRAQLVWPIRHVLLGNLACMGVIRGEATGPPAEKSLAFSESVLRKVPRTILVSRGAIGSCHFARTLHAKWNDPA